MTVAIVAALFFSGNYARSSALHQYRYIAAPLSVSRFSRRVHRVKDLFLTLFALLGAYWKDLNSESVYVIDSFPIAS